MTTTWIRLSLYGGDETRSFLIPTLNISTYSDLTQTIHSIFRISAEAFPSFDVHTENDTECDETLSLLSPHLWDLGLYFSRAPEKAVEVFVHFKPKPPAAAPAEEESTAAGHQSPKKKPASSKQDHQQWSQEEIDAAEALLALSRQSWPQPLPQQQLSPQPQHHPQNSSKRARNTSSNSSSSSSSSSEDSLPVIRKRRARSAPPARRQQHQQQQPSSSSSSSPLSSVPPSSGLSSPPADDELDAQQRELDQQQAPVLQQEEEEEKRGTTTTTAPPPAFTTVTLHLRYLNRMTRSHGAAVPDLVLRAVPASRRLADLEDAVKNHACEAFLLLTMGSGRHQQRLSQRQGLELVECLAVRVFVNGHGGGDALRERRSVGEYAVVEEGKEGEEEEERVVRGTVEMWREEHIAMEVLRRESPTGDEEE